MIPQISKIEYVETDNEVESLILESALIKKHMPPYNIMLKDDKSYAWVFISTKEKIPQVKVVHTLNKEEYANGKLFGPYPKGRSVRQVFNYLRKLYPFCSCKNDREEQIYYQIGLCPGPHLGYISERDYKANIKGMMDFLNGRVKKPISDLEREMKQYAILMNYEKAAQLRDKITDLKYLSQKINLNFFESEDEYAARRNMVLKNEVIDLAAQVGLKTLHRIECYDISNIQGKLAYGSMTVAIDGNSDPNMYRIFKIKTVEKSDDPEMLREVIKRRLAHIGRTDTDIDVSLSELPDMLLIDGGKAQFSKLIDIVPSNIFMLGITKGRKYKRRGFKKRDEFWVYDKAEDKVNQVILKNTAVLSNLRDEAHRFAIKHHRRARSKAMLAKA
jgi:excinuclease ABC subunit C